MTEALVYIAFSVFEGFTVFFFAFGLFRISLQDYWKEVLIAIISISLGTYFYSEYDSLSVMSPLFNMTAMILFLTFLFRMSLLHSFYIVSTSFVTLFVLQGIALSTIGTLAGLTLETIKETDILRYTFQLTTDISLFGLSVLLRKQGWWFTFVPYHSKLIFKMNISNLSILFASILGIAATGMVFNIDSIAMGTVFWCICVSQLVYIGVKKEIRGEQE